VRLFALTGLLLALAASPACGATGKVAMNDGVKLAYTLVEPAGKPPAGGWPGVVVMHGLGGSDRQVAPIARYLAQHGYAALAFSVRGQGGSGGSLGLAGPRDVQDMKAMVAWLAAKPEVSGRIGCFGISLGGGECWNATPTGIFGAVVPVATWTNLATALWPGGVARSGVVAALVGSVPSSSLLGAAGLTGTLSPFASALLAQRSVGARLGEIRTPVSMFQGRVDWVFDVDQALAAYAKLRGPKRLYLGDFGHPPSSFSSADFPSYVVAQSVRWFDRYLKGRHNGVDRPGVTLADGTGSHRVSFPRPPRTSVVHAGRATRALQTFGDSTVRVRVRSLKSFPRLVAVVLADGKPVTHGAVVPRVGTNTIRLADYVVAIAKGARVTVRLGGDGGRVDPAYSGVAARGSIRHGVATLDLHVLAR
jgi:predicted acyl esterase